MVELSGLFFAVFRTMASRKKVRNLLLIGGILYVGYWLYSRTLAKISIGSPTMKIWGLKGTDLELRIFLPIINESDVPVTITGFLGQIFYNGSSFGTISLVNPVPISGFGQSVVEFRLVTGLFGTALEILNILTGGNPLNWKNANYANIDWSAFTLMGTLKVGKLPVDIKTKLLG